MKSVIASAVILACILSAVLCVAIYSRRLLGKLEDTVDELPKSISEAAEHVDDIKKHYKKIKPFLSLFACDSEAREIEMYIEDIKSAIAENDDDALLIAKSRLKLHIEQLRRLSGFSIEAIF